MMLLTSPSSSRIIAGFPDFQAVKRRPSFEDIFKVSADHYDRPFQYSPPKDLSKRRLLALGWFLLTTGALLAAAIVSFHKDSSISLSSVVASAPQSSSLPPFSIPPKAKSVTKSATLSKPKMKVAEKVQKRKGIEAYDDVDPQTWKTKIDGESPNQKKKLLNSLLSKKELLTAERFPLFEMLVSTGENRQKEKAILAGISKLKATSAPKPLDKMMVSFLLKDASNNFNWSPEQKDLLCQVIKESVAPEALRDTDFAALLQGYKPVISKPCNKAGCMTANTWRPCGCSCKHLRHSKLRIK